MRRGRLERVLLERDFPPDRPERRNAGMVADQVRHSREVMLREEHSGPDHRYLWAYLDQVGNQHIDGQDLGPDTTPVSSDGDYEWFQTIWSRDLSSTPPEFAECRPRISPRS